MNRRNLFQRAGSFTLGAMGAMLGIRPKKTEATVEPNPPQRFRPGVLLPMVVDLTRTTEKAPDFSADLSQTTETPPSTLGWRFKVTMPDGVDFWTDPLPPPFEGAAELDWFAATENVGEVRLRPLSQKMPYGSTCEYPWQKFPMKTNSNSVGREGPSHTPFIMFANKDAAMKTIFTILLLILLSSTATAQFGQPLGAFRSNPYDQGSIANPFGAGSPYRADGLMSPYGRFGSPASNQSWRNPYATQAPRLFEGGQYRGRLSTNRFEHDSTSNPFGRYGSPFSSESINNPFSAGSPFNTKPIYVWPGR